MDRQEYSQEGCIDLRRGFGDFMDYKLSKFPDNSIKFIIKDVKYFYPVEGYCTVRTTLRTNDDLITLALVKDVLKSFDKFSNVKFRLRIDYLMYQQDDREFSKEESFGLKVIANFINQMKWDRVEIFHPHSDNVELIDNLTIIPNTCFIVNSFMIQHAIYNESCHLDGTFEYEEPVWVIPNSGAFKTQFNQLKELNQKEYITCYKSRDPAIGEITTIIDVEDLQGKECFIVDDICLGGTTFLNIAEELKKKNCGKLYLVVSHGVFNKGIEHLLQYFDTIYTTNSICTIKHPKLSIYELP